MQVVERGKRNGKKSKSKGKMKETTTATARDTDRTWKGKIEAY